MKKQLPTRVNSRFERQGKSRMTNKKPTTKE